MLYLRCVTGLLIRFFEMYKDLVIIILRECKKFPEALWSIYCWFIGPINFKVYTINSVNIKRIHFSHLNE